MTATFRNTDNMQHEPVRPVDSQSLNANGAKPHLRELAEEVPIAMVFDGSSAAVMMASPTDLEDFASGFALTEGFISGPEDISEFELVAHDTGIEARFWLRSDRSEALAARRRVLAGPIGCGLCGIDSLEQAVRRVPKLPDTGFQIAYSEANAASEALRAAQPLHDRCRALHAAGFYLPGKGLLVAREDVGRHNALDKLIGALSQQGIDPATGAFVITSRISVELIQKTAMAGCSMLIAVSAPTAHAVRLAEEAALTLAAFAKGQGIEVYSHPERIAPQNA